MGELYLFADNIFTGTRRILAERSGPYFDRWFFVFHRKSFRKRIFVKQSRCCIGYSTEDRKQRNTTDIFSDDVEHNKINRLWEMLTNQIKQHSHVFSSVILSN